MTLTELCTAIEAVVDYNWDKELEDFKEQDDVGREAHIFHHLVELNNYVHHKNETVSSYLPDSEEEEEE